MDQHARDMNTFIWMRVVCSLQHYHLKISSLMRRLEKRYILQICFVIPSQII